jgi:hypothetical protein
MNNNSSYRMDDILLKHLAEVLSFRIWKLAGDERNGSRSFGNVSHSDDLYFCTRTECKQ